MKNNSLLHRIFKSKEIGIVIILIVLSILIQIKNPIFLTYSNIIDVCRNTSYTLVIAVGMTFVLIAKGLDLSVGSVMALGGLIASLAMFNGIPIILACILGVLVGCAFGLINAGCIVILHIPAMIASLGTMYMARGLVLVVTKGSPVFPLPEAFGRFGKGYFLKVPYVVWIAGLLAIVGHLVLNHTTYGRKVYAIGGNAETAKFAGINIGAVTASCYVLSGGLAALAGILTAARMGSGQPSIGDGTEMTVITAVIIGGTSLNGGAGTMLGTVLGALLMNVLSSGMNLVGISAYWQKFVMGVIIIFAVGFDMYQRSRRRS